MFKNYLACHKLVYRTPDQNLLFENVSFDLEEGEKAALIGENGCGKSTLLKIINGEILPESGKVTLNTACSYLLQKTGEISGRVIDVLGLKDKIEALAKITEGMATEEDFEIVGQDWDIWERLNQELEEWGMPGLDIYRDFDCLSGGEKEKILLIRIFLNPSDIILLDEPTNNLDKKTKDQFIEKLMQLKQGVLLVCHDREILEKVSTILELSKKGIERFGGNYTFYQSEKFRQQNILEAQINNLKKQADKLKERQQDVLKNRAKENAYGEKQIANHRYSRMAGAALKIQAEATSGKQTQATKAKIAECEEEIYNLELKKKNEPLKIPLPTRPFIRERLLEISGVSFGYDSKPLFEDFDLLLKSGERVAITGDNGCGKSTLLKLIAGQLIPQKGSLKLNGKAVYLNQALDMLNQDVNLIAAISELNPKASVNMVRATLANFKFRNIMGEKIVNKLSGGELLRASLAAIFCCNEQPDILILDEPTNNLDIKSIEILEEALAWYQGTILAVSHDATFLENIKISRFINLRASCFRDKETLY